MMQDTNSFSLEEWIQWFQDVQNPATLKQLGAIIGLGVLAWLFACLLRKLFRPNMTEEQRQRSLLFGMHDYEGLLFPALWLLMTRIASHLMRVPLHQSLYRVALPAIFALLLIRTVVKSLRLTFKQWRWIGVFERTLSWFVWVGVVLWISGLLPFVINLLDEMQISIGSIKTSLLGLVLAPVTAIFSVLVSLWLASLIEARLLGNATGSTLSFRKIISNAVRGLLLLCGLLVGLRAANIDLTALSVFSGAVGVGIGLGLQKLASNYVSGFVVLAERNVRIGDYVKIGGFEGVVRDIAARYTVIRSIAGVDAILPNDMLVNQYVENSSLGDSPVWQSVTVGVDYGCDVDLVQKLLVDAALSQSRVLRDPMPAANLIDFGPDSLIFRLGYWIFDPETATGKLGSDIRKHMLRSLNEHKIGITYPQRELRIAEGQSPLTVVVQNAAASSNGQTLQAGKPSQPN